MSYIMQDQFAQRFGAAELSDLTAENDFDAVAADAESLINGYLSSRYSLPLSTVPTMVQGWAADIARYRLWDEHAPEEVRRRYEDALAQLKMVSQGIIALPPGSDGAPATSAGMKFGGYSADRVFTSETLRGY